MKIFIELSTFLAKSRQNGFIEFEGETVADAIAAFGLDTAEAYIVINRDKKCMMSDKLTDGETYKIFPSIMEG
ncbi:MAG: hypothetical protein ACYCWE_16460 [Eubacteriales bacterium]